MFRKSQLLVVIFASTFSMVAAAQNAQPPAKLSAAEIADRSVVAQGGLQAWRAVETMVMTGKMDAGGNNRPALTTPAPGTARKSNQAAIPQRPVEQAQLPFTMELKRPRKMRVELEFHGQTAIQVFDGSEGWKLRPFLNRHEVEAYTADQLQSASMQSELDGPLVDYATKGTKVELVGVEKVEDRDAYRLKLTLQFGHTKDIWIDTQTFLQTKVEGNPRRLDGRMHPVEIYYRDYRTVGGLKIPFTLETRVLEGPTIRGVRNPPTAKERIVLEKVSVNTKLTDAMFTKADLLHAAVPSPAPKPAKYPLP